MPEYELFGIDPTDYNTWATLDNDHAAHVTITMEMLRKTLMEVSSVNDLYIGKPANYWTQANGEKIKISDMTDLHLENSIAMCKRNRSRTQSFKNLLMEKEYRDKIPKFIDEGESEDLGMECF